MNRGTVRPVKAEDIDKLVDIYNYYIVNSSFTFAETQIDSNYFYQLIDKVKAIDSVFLVLEYESHIRGFAYAGPWRERSAYRYSLESSIYLDHQYLGQGLGLPLYQALIDALRTDTPFRLLIAGITLPNPVSVSFHEKLGFSKVAHFHEVGYKFREWLDVGYWSLKL